MGHDHAGGLVDLGPLRPGPLPDVVLRLAVREQGCDVDLRDDGCGIEVEVPGRPGLVEREDPDRALGLAEGERVHDERG